MYYSPPTVSFSPPETRLQKNLCAYYCPVSSSSRVDCEYCFRMCAVTTKMKAGLTANEVKDVRATLQYVLSSNIGDLSSGLLLEYLLVLETYSASNARILYD